MARYNLKNIEELEEQAGLAKRAATARSGLADAERAMADDRARSWNESLMAARDRRLSTQNQIALRDPGRYSTQVREGAMAWEANRQREKQRDAEMAMRAQESADKREGMIGQGSVAAMHHAEAEIEKAHGQHGYVDLEGDWIQGSAERVAARQAAAQEAVAGMQAGSNEAIERQKRESAKEVENIKKETSVEVAKQQKMAEIAKQSLQIAENAIKNDEAMARIEKQIGGNVARDKIKRVTQAYITALKDPTNIGDPKRAIEAVKKALGAEDPEVDTVISNLTGGSILDASRID